MLISLTITGLASGTVFSPVQLLVSINIPVRALALNVPASICCAFLYRTHVKALQSPDILSCMFV